MNELRATLHLMKGQGWREGEKEGREGRKDKEGGKEGKIRKKIEGRRRVEECRV